MKSKNPHIFENSPIWVLLTTQAVAEEVTLVKALLQCLQKQNLAHNSHGKVYGGEHDLSVPLPQNTFHSWNKPSSPSPTEKSS